MRVLAIVLGVVLLLLQFRLWASDEGAREVWQLSETVAGQRAENDLLRQRNGQLKAEVQDLKQGLAALEERARHDLGMVGASETFFHVVDPQDAAAVHRPLAPSTTQAAGR